MTQRRRAVKNPLALAVLSYLVAGPLHPYELGTELRERGDDRSIKFAPGSLYAAVQQLERAGFIAALETQRAGQRPERTVYGLTPEGRQELTDWLSDLLAEPTHEYPQFVAALSLVAALPPTEVVALLRRRLDRLTDLRAETRELIHRTLAQGVPALFLVEEEFRLTLLDAEHAFVEQLCSDITNPATDWAQGWAEFHATSRTDERPTDE